MPPEYYKEYRKRPEAIARAKARRIRDRRKESEAARLQYRSSQRQRWVVVERQLRFKYGIDTHDWALMYERQHGGCGICRRRTPVKKLYVDHDHDTGKVRALLCSRCNFVLGHLEKLGVRGFANYMLEHGSAAAMRVRTPEHLMTAPRRNHQSTSSSPAAPLAEA